MFKPFLRQAFGAAFLAAAIAAPVQADTITSSASSAGSASSGSVSDSISGSSKSSSGDKKVAAGQYRVIDIAQAPGKADTARLTLRAGAEEFFLDLPNRVLDKQPLVAGDLVDVRERTYGYEFANVQTRQTFFLALHDNWYSELRSNAI